MQRPHLKKKVVLLLLTLCMILWPLAVSANLITFETKDVDTEIQGQFSSDNIIFSDSSNINGNAPGSVALFGYFSDKSMKAYLSGGQYSMYILFNTPISYLEAYIYRGRIRKRHSYRTSRRTSRRNSRSARR